MATRGAKPPTPIPPKPMAPSELERRVVELEERVRALEQRARLRDRVYDEPRQTADERRRQG